MSTTQTMSSALKRQGLSAQFWRVGLLTLLAAVVINTVIALAAHILFMVAPTFVPLQVASVIPATAVAVTGALLVLALISRRSQRPVRLFRRIALLVLLVSIIPDLLLPVIGLYPGTTLPAIGMIMLMHLVTASLCITMAPRIIDIRN